MLDPALQATLARGLRDIAKGSDWSFAFFCDIKDVVVPAKPFRASFSQR